MSVRVKKEGPVLRRNKKQTLNATVFETEIVCQTFLLKGLYGWV